MFTSLNDIKKAVLSLNKRKKLVLAAAEDVHALEAVYQAKINGIIEPILIGDEKKIHEIANSSKISLDGIEIHNEVDKISAVEKSVRMIKSGEADILMKGKVGTAGLLKGILNKEWGMRKGKLLSHFALFEIPEIRVSPCI